MDDARRELDAAKKKARLTRLTGKRGELDLSKLSPEARKLAEEEARRAKLTGSG